MTMREQAMATVVELFERDEDVAVIMADISLDYLRSAVEHDPRRAINVGIMEQSAVGVAAGFALEGYHPIVHTLAPFLAERPLEQIKVDFGYQGLGGLFISAGASYDYGESGGTHHAGAEAQRGADRPAGRPHICANGDSCQARHRRDEAVVLLA